MKLIARINSHSLLLLLSLTTTKNIYICKNITEINKAKQNKNMSILYYNSYCRLNFFTRSRTDIIVGSFSLSFEVRDDCSDVTVLIIGCSFCNTSV